MVEITRYLDGSKRSALRRCELDGTCPVAYFNIGNFCITNLVPNAEIVEFRMRPED
jgi:hypothetical protein